VALNIGRAEITRMKIENREDISLPNIKEEEPSEVLKSESRVILSFS